MLSTEGSATEAAAKLDTEYSILTQNLGFGAYTADYTFFMDGGKESRARSKESVVNCIDSAVKTIMEREPDYILFQEMDIDSTRSFHVNQYEQIANELPGFCHTFAVNYHSAYLMYPILCPHGASNSGIATFSKSALDGGLRRSLPISESFSKLIDLDRCYSISRGPVEDGKELVLFNVHLSAYAADSNLKESQLEMLFQDMEAEYKKGNYVICGGDFNADLTGTSLKILNGEDAEEFGWTMPFPEQLIPEHFSRCMDYSSGKIEPTCRNNDVPYQEGNFTILVDGFIVSDNVEVTYLENIQTGFAYSDHGPVHMKFMLRSN